MIECDPQRPFAAVDWQASAAMAERARQAIRDMMLAAGEAED
jgi:hypothetical protein